MGMQSVTASPLKVSGYKVVGMEATAFGLAQTLSKTNINFSYSDSTSVTPFVFTVLYKH